VWVTTCAWQAIGWSEALSYLRRSNYCGWFSGADALHTARSRFIANSFLCHFLKLLSHAP
jgi:hypothetical protein